MDPREKRFLAGDPPELIEKPSRKGKWRDRDGLFWTDDDMPLDEEENDG